MDINKEVELLREFNNFVTDISFDYDDPVESDCHSFLGLAAIRVLAKGKQSEEEFRKVWLKWKENIGLEVDPDGDQKGGNQHGKEKK